jgi:predicted Fe-Mo cluster-binding NifX family protein
MKVAIPTDDGFIVREQFRGSRGYIVATVLEGKIIHQELRWNLLSEIMTSEHGFLYNLIDCDVIIIKKSGIINYELLQLKTFKILQTDQLEILNALTNYLESIPGFTEKILIT